MPKPSFFFFWVESFCLTFPSLKKKQQFSHTQDSARFPFAHTHTWFYQESLQELWESRVFGEVCRGCHIRFIKIFRHQKGKKTQNNQWIWFQILSLNQQVEESSHGTTDSFYSAAFKISRSLVPFFDLLHPYAPSSPGYPCSAVTAPISSPLPCSLCKQKHRPCSFHTPGWTQSHTSETGKEETQMSCLTGPEKVRIKIQVFFQAQQLSLRTITSFWNIYTLV